MSKNSIIFDYCIWGATLQGIAAASLLRGRGFRVKILNRYGFPGGSITESLNCSQKIPKTLPENLSLIFESLRKKKQYFLKSETDKYLFNPEVVKISLQEFLEDSGTDVLYHVVPKEVAKEFDTMKITLIAKEGIIEVYSKNFIDASDDLSGIMSESSVNASFRYFYNIFINSGQKFTLPAEFNIYNQVILEDGRVWYSFALQPINNLFSELYAQILINKLSEHFNNTGRRIQLLPAQSHIQKSASIPETSEGTIIANYENDSFHFSPDEEFIKAKEFEIRLTKKITC